MGIGYNGFPMGCSDDELPWAREAESELDTKYPVRRSKAFCSRYRIHRASASGGKSFIRDRYPSVQCANIVQFYFLMSKHVYRQTSVCGSTHSRGYMASVDARGIYVVGCGRCVFEKACSPYC